MKIKYNIKDFIYDLAYIAVLIGIALLIVGSFPGFFSNLLHLNN